MDFEKMMRENALAQMQYDIEKEQRKTLTGYLDIVLRNNCPREIKQEAILAMFSPEFKEQIKYSQLEKNIFEILIRDGDIFKLIEGLVNNIKDQQNHLKKLIENYPVPPNFNK